MLEEDNGTLRRVAWSEIFPWLLIFRAFRPAIRLPVLFLAAVGIFLTLCGWAVLGWMFSVDAETGQWMRPHDGCPWLAVDQAVENSLGVPEIPDPTEADQLAPTAWRALDPFSGAWAQLSRPLWAARDPGVGFADLVCLLLCGLWSLAVWAFFGGAISRIAAVELAADERVGLAGAIRHARSKWRDYCAAPLFPLLGILPAAAMIYLLSLPLLADVSIFLTALLWPILLVAGLVMSVLLLGLIFGWPLMFATISAEGSDNFDALSRSYAYVFQRPLRCLFYVLVAMVFGALGWLLVSNFAAGVVGLTYWTAGWAAGSEEIGEKVVPRINWIIDGNEQLGTAGGAGAWLIHLWAGCVKLLAVGFVYSYFWTATTAIYFLLRHDVDATEMDEVFLDEDASEQTYGLPPLGTDAAGAPIVNDDEPDAAPPEDIQ